VRDGTLEKRPESTLGDVQHILDEVVACYNNVHSRHSVGRRTPSVTCNARATKSHALIHQPHWRIRTDTVDVRGHVTLRYLGKLRHLNVGWTYRGAVIKLYVLDDVVTFATEEGEFIRERGSTPTAATNPRAMASRDSLHRFACSR
jgi:hypothetical protein